VGCLLVLKAFCEYRLSVSNQKKKTAHTTNKTGSKMGKANFRI
jgi:hypothetical protein